jgi:MFS family permease
MLSLLRRVAVDTTAIRESRQFRLLAIGQMIAALGSQATLVALPYQIYVVSHSAALVGTLGAFELGPMIVVGLIGGVLADRHDRRQVLLVAQVGVIAVASVLAATTLATGRPPVIVILLLGGLLAGAVTLTTVARSAMIPGILGPRLVRAGIAFNYGTLQVTAIAGPGLGGVLIGLTGVSGVYVANAICAGGMLIAALALVPQVPEEVSEHPPVRRAIAEGLRYVVSDRALAGSFVIDINAMAFGMPRALFAVLALTVYHAGAGGTGLLYAAVAAGGTIAVLSSGWVAHARRLGRIVIGAVVVWGVAILGAGLVRSIAPAALLFAAAGWADGVSAVCRTTITQLTTPEHLRGRLSAVFSLVVTSGPRLGDIESGLVAGVVGALDSVALGGAACVVGVGLVALAFPELARFDAETAMVASGLAGGDLHAVAPDPATSG